MICDIYVWQVEAELIAEREKAKREADRAKEEIRQKAEELAAIEEQRRKEVGVSGVFYSPLGGVGAWLGFHLVCRGVKRRLTGSWRRLAKRRRN